MKNIYGKSMAERGLAGVALVSTSNYYSPQRLARLQFIQWPS